MTTLRERELELAWLTGKVKGDESIIERAEDFFQDNHHKWSKGVTAYFLDMLEKMRDQIYYEHHRLEKLACQIILERDAHA